MPDVDIVEQAARKVFDKYDLDGDGQITVAEYQQAVTELGETGTDEAAASGLVAQLDRDGDQMVSFDEFWQGINGR